MNALTRRRTLLTSVLTLLLAVVMAPAQADGATDSGRWQWGAQLYLWGSGISGTTVTGDDIDIPFEDLISSLDLAFMGTLSASRGPWTLFADLLYMDVSEDDTTTADLVGFPVEARVEVQMESVVTTLGVAYEVLAGGATRLNALAGARYLWLRTDLDFQIGPIQRGVSASDVAWDGIIGLQGVTELNDRWYVNYYVDVGAGGSDLTWQALAGVNYRFSRVDAVLGYRYLAWELDDSDIMDDLEISGPYAGVRFRF